MRCKSARPDLVFEFHCNTPLVYPSTTVARLSAQKPYPPTV